MSEFEDFIRSQGFSGDFQRGCNGQYKSDLLHFMEKAFMHQQAKIDEIAKHVACIKTIVSECDENTDSSWILGNIDGFIECMEKIINDQSN